MTATFTPTDTTDYNSATVTVSLVVNRATPTLSWAAPAAITYGTSLSGSQLDATANVPGTFSYSPAAGTVLTTGTQTLTVTFTPTDTTDYNNATQTVSLVVNRAILTLSWGTPAAITYGTPLSSSQLDATASVPGSFSYSPAAGTVLGAGTQTLTATFTPTDTTDYNSTTQTVSLVVNRATPTLSWLTPAAITFGTPLTGSQLDASANVPGSISYSPAAGTVLGAGTQTLTASFTPTDSTDYNNATQTVSLVVNRATPTLSWVTPAAITYGTPLTGSQLDATANVPGSFSYSPTAGTVLGAGTQTLTATFTPTDTIDYSSVTQTVSQVVMLAIDAGGPTAGIYQSDTDFVGGSLYSVPNAVINTSGVTNPALQAVYQTARWGNFSYVLPNLTPGADYTVQLQFAQLVWNTAGSRLFNVTINGKPALTNFDIFAAAGGKDIAVAESFTVPADANGNITLVFTTISDEAEVNAIEVQPALYTPVFSSIAVTPGPATVQEGGTQQFTATALDQYGVPLQNQPSVTWTVDNGGVGTVSTSGLYTATTSGTGSAVVRASVSGISGTAAVTVTNAMLAIHAGGAAAGIYQADEDYVGGSLYSVPNAVINTSGVTNPAPQAVYQTERYGNFSYVLPNLTPGAAYTVRLHFAELVWNTPGGRLFNVTINGNPVLTNFDIFATAGGKDIALVESFVAVADANGKITLVFTTISDQAEVNGIVVTPSIYTPVFSSIAVTPGPVTVQEGGTQQFTATAAGPVRHAATEPAGHDLDGGQRRCGDGQHERAVHGAGQWYGQRGGPGERERNQWHGGCDGDQRGVGHRRWRAGGGELPGGCGLRRREPLLGPERGDQHLRGNESGAAGGVPDRALWQFQLRAAESDARGGLYGAAALRGVGLEHPGGRLFNVTINGNPVLTNFDIFATAGGKDIALVESFAAVADATGKITLVFTTISDQAEVNGIEVLPLIYTPVFSSIAVAPGTATVQNGGTQQFTATALDQYGMPLQNQPSVTWTVDNGSVGTVSASGLYSAPTSGTGSAVIRASVNGISGTAAVTVTNDVLAIDAGGSAAGIYQSDTDFVGGSLYSVPNAVINTSGVTNPAPQAVYQTERYGNFRYVLPNLTPGTAYTVQLLFAELVWNVAGGRLFNVTINGNPVLTNFDIFAAAGGMDIALVESFTAVADANGEITLVFTTISDQAEVNGIQVLP